MTLVIDRPELIGETPFDTELLIEEVRQRARRRRRRIAGAAALLLAAAISSFVATRGPTVPGLGASMPAQSFANVVVPATLAAKSASFSMTEATLQTPYFSCVRNQSSEVTSGSGAIDFATSTLSYIQTDGGCATLGFSYCVTPSVPTVMTEGELYQYDVGQGMTCFRHTTSGMQKRVLVPSRPATSRLWSETPLSVDAQEADDASYEPEISDLLVSSRPPSVLEALRGRITRVGVSTISGSPATEYRGVATLASVQAVAGFHSPSTALQGTPQPRASRISISIDVWVDDADRVVRISTVEPLFAEVQNGGVYSGFIQVLSGEFAGGWQLAQRDYALATVGLSYPGRPSLATIPPASEVGSAQN